MTVTVEWVFGDVINYSKHMNFKKNLKIGLGCAGEIYWVSAQWHNWVKNLGRCVLKIFGHIHLHELRNVQYD